MVLQVLADVGEVHNRLDANLLQCSGVANTRELKKLWGSNRPRGEDNFVGGIYGVEWTYVKSMDENGRSFLPGERITCQMQRPQIVYREKLGVCPECLSGRSSLLEC